MMNKMSGRPICHSERSEESLILKIAPHAIKPEVFESLTAYFAFRCNAPFNMTARSMNKSLRARRLATGQAAKRLNVFGRTFFDHFLRQTRSRGSLVPIECLQIIADKLFVEARRALPDRVLVLGPEARRIWCQTFVDQKQIFIHSAELKFRVCDDNSTLVGVCAAARINVQAELFHALG